jgi:threonine/homoserine/homoserine lactone efflux protein
MDISILLRGLLIGFSIAAPVGPIGVLCIRRTLTDGRASGLVSGLGAATADAFYGSIAGFGLTFISSFLIDQQLWLRLVGGAFLLYLGVRTFLSKPSERAAEATSNNLVSAYASTLFLTITNPMTIISFAAIFAGLGIGSMNGDFGAAAILVLGVFIGSAMWWLVLSGGVSIFRARFDVRALSWVNKISGVIITVFGLFALASLLA